MKKEIKITIKNRFTGFVLFEFSKENNTIKDTVIEAVNQKASLRGADLQGADLQGADLQGASLQEADLRGADLRLADLRGASLRGADLRGASLQEADLRGASLQRVDLQGADLQGASLQNLKIRKTAVFTGLYKYIVMPIISEDDKHYIRLGCYIRLVSEWEDDFWNNDNEFPNDGKLKSEYRKMAFEFCKKWIELNK